MRLAPSRFIFFFSNVIAIYQSISISFAHHAINLPKLISQPIYIRYIS